MSSIYEKTAGEFFFSSDPHKFQMDVIHGFLTHSYWREGESEAEVRRSIEHSVGFGCYHQDRQMGFARVVTDYTRIAYIFDVFILEPYRDRGLGTRLITFVLEHPELKPVAKWMLTTRDAHGLYRKLGFTPIANPERLMQRLDSTQLGVLTTPHEIRNESSFVDRSLGREHATGVGVSGKDRL